MLDISLGILGMKEEAERLKNAVGSVLKEGYRTIDIADKTIDTA